MAFPRLKFLQNIMHNFLYVFFQIIIFILFKNL